MSTEAPTKIAVTGAGHRVEKLASPRDGAAQDEAAPEPDLDDEIPF